jgi:signal transduction histidine kinase/DNA-binding response OmpR family regulator
VTTLGVVACLIAMTWVFTIRSIDTQRIEMSNRIAARVSNQALTFSEQIGRQILAIDQTLRILSGMWEQNAATFDLEAWWPRMVSVGGISRDLLLVDETGIVRQSTIPEALGQSVADRDFFRTAMADPATRDRLFVGTTTIDPLIRVWHMNVSRALITTDGRFAGMLVVDYRTAALAEVFSQTNVDENGLVALIGLTDGLIRAAVGPSVVDPEASQLATPMFRALRRTPDGMWVGFSAPDSVRRIHAFRAVPGHDLAVVVAMDEARALRPVTDWRFQARAFAGGVTVLLLIIVVMMLYAARQVLRREAALAEEQAVLAAANAQLEVARAEAAAKTEQLQATLRGMTDGVSMVDAHLCLLEWNDRFPEIAGVPADSLRVGMPMEEVLRIQARNGQFGEVDVEAEVSRRMARLRAGRFGVTQRRTPDGRTLELRRRGLPDGGFVTLYSDVTAHKQAEDALREARAAAEEANAAKSRFVAIVSHEIRTPLNGLLNALRLLADSPLPPAQRPVVDMARASGDALSSLISDILELSRAEARELTLRPSVFALRSVLEASLEVFQAQARPRGITFHLDIADDVPAELRTDPGRLRQILLNLLSNAVKFADPGEVRLLAWMEPRTAGVRRVLGLSVRDQGPIIPIDDRAELFRPFARLERPEGAEVVGTGLGLSICHALCEAMGGAIGYDTWTGADGKQGNAFWLALPVEVPPSPTPTQQPDPTSGTLAEEVDYALPQPVTAADLVRPLPRTRVLLVEDIRANQLVTSTLLRRLGHLVDPAGSGQEAIEAARRSPYDIIFMDIFMPGMSGQEATQHIRDLGGPLAQVPIVALTANVAAHDAAVFRAAGMSGVLGKPVTLEDLTDALRHYVWAPPPAPASAPIDVFPQPEAPADDRPILAMGRLTELTSNLPRAALVGLVEECLTDLDLRLPALRRAMAAGVPGSIVAHAHAMTGMASSYGMAALESRLRAIE